MKILITGGNGFIGYNLAQTLKLNHDVTVLDRNFTKDFSNIRTIKLDMTNLDDLKTISLDYDCIFHFACILGVKNFTSYQSEAFSTDTKISENFLEVLKSQNYKGRIYFASTSEVYGNCDNENFYSILKGPRGLYSLDKLMFEMKCRNLGLKITSLRFFNIVGKGQSSSEGHVIPTFIENIKNDKPIKLDREGSDIRCFCDIRDCVSQIVQILENTKHNDYYDHYDIGNTKPIRIKDLLSLIETKLKKKAIKEKGNQNKAISFRQPKNNFKCKYNIEDTLDSIIFG